MKTNHAHVEAATFALLIIALVALIDWFVEFLDGEPLKLFYYFGLYILFYLVLRIIFKKLWSG